MEKFKLSTGWDWLARLVRHLSSWAWKPVVWDAAEVHELHYRHTSRTYGGDVVHARCMSRWTTQAEAEEAEKRAWEYYGWKKLEPKKDGTVTWIETRPIHSLPNDKAKRAVNPAPTSQSNDDTASL
jgi:hypothetical protein